MTAPRTGPDGRTTGYPPEDRTRAPRRRPVAARIRRRRAAATGLVVVIAAATAWFAVHHDSRPPAPKKTLPPVRAIVAPPILLAAEAGLLPWHLADPLSREALVARSSGQLIVLGGLTSSGASSNAVYALRTATGTARQIGTLSAPVHDAAAAVSGGQALIFGGGSPATVPTVQAFALPGAGGGTSATTTPVSLPAPRSDAAAVTIAGTTYVVGGYDGTGPDAAVLATSNGQAYRTVAALPVPVRYPAVAALDGQIFVFGGQAITGPAAGAPVNVIQAVNPARRTAAVIGHLPEPLAGAVAVTLDGEVFVAGGESTADQHLVPGAGTTQTGSAESRGTTVSTIWAFNPATSRLLPAGRLQVPVSHAAAAVSGSTAWIVGGESNGAAVDSVQMLRPSKAFGTAGKPGAGSPYFGGELLIADRGNNRLLVLDAQMNVVWVYPSASLPRDPLQFYYPDDAFFIDHGTAIISNQEQNETIVEIAYPSGKIVWDYGHPRQVGTARGYLSEPDDAYLLKNGQITVADAQNCRVLVINPDKRVAHQIGTDGVCVHHPPTSMGSPNGDTPLADGNLLISEVNGSWISEYTPTGKLVWTAAVPVSYPSDPQQLGPDRYLMVDYASPGQIVVFDRKGKITYRYDPSSGPGRLDHPSLAELLPSGVFMLNDDYNDRMVAIDPVTGALVWQYGVTGKPGTGYGELNIPDGFDLVLPDGSTPTHSVTG